MIIKQNKGQTVLYTIITFFAFATFAFAAIFDLRRIPHENSAWIDNPVRYWIFRSLFFVCAVITAAALVWFIKQMFSKEPLIEICDDYFYDNSSAVSLGKIAWSDMKKAYLKSGFLNIELENPDDYFKRMNWLQKLMIKSNLKLGYSNVCISTQRFYKQSKEFMDEFSKRMEIGKL